MIFSNPDLKEIFPEPPMAAFRQGPKENIYVEQHFKSLPGVTNYREMQEKMQLVGRNAPNPALCALSLPPLNTQ
jgi:hypothetical protein